MPDVSPFFFHAAMLRALFRAVATILHAVYLLLLIDTRDARYA